MQKYANLVELEKCCQTRIFLQNFVLIQPRTSPPKNLQKFANFSILLILTPEDLGALGAGHDIRQDEAGREGGGEDGARTVLLRQRQLRGRERRDDLWQEASPWLPLSRLLSLSRKFIRAQREMFWSTLKIRSIYDTFETFVVSRRRSFQPGPKFSDRRL